MAEIGPLIPPAAGNKRTADIREIVNGVMDVLSTGCEWRAIPKDLPPKSAVHDYLERWICNGTLERMHHALYVNLDPAVESLHGPAESAESAGMKAELTALPAHLPVSNLQ